MICIEINPIFLALEFDLFVISLHRALHFKDDQYSIIYKLLFILDLYLLLFRKIDL